MTDQVSDLLASYARGILSRAEAREVELAVDADPQLRAELDEMVKALAVLDWIGVRAVSAPEPIVWWRIDGD